MQDWVQRLISLDWNSQKKLLNISLRKIVYQDEKLCTGWSQKIPFSLALEKFGTGNGNRDNRQGEG